MRLSTPHTTIDGVNATDIQQVFNDAPLRGNLVVLSANEDEYIQAAGELDGPFLVEYRDGHAGNHHLMTLEEARQAFVEYLRRDSAWRNNARPSERRVITLVAIASTLGTICSLFV
ncbi:MAG: hypothetical protein K1X74_03810 [Pirellulales bacterium]|nr:hypothetical protein [Pirellulales bacterium]